MEPNFSLDAEDLFPWLVDERFALFVTGHSIDDVLATQSRNVLKRIVSRVFR